MGFLLLHDAYGIDATLPYSWRIRQTLDATALPYSWRIRTTLDKALVYSWKIWGYIDKTLDYSWRIRRYLDRLLAYSWQIIHLAGSSKPRHTFRMAGRAMRIYSSNVVNNYKRKYGETKDNETIL